MKRNCSRNSSEKKRGWNKRTEGIEWEMDDAVSTNMSSQVRTPDVFLSTGKHLQEEKRSQFQVRSLVWWRRMDLKARKGKEGWVQETRLNEPASLEWKKGMRLPFLGNCFALTLFEPDSVLLDPPDCQLRIVSCFAGKCEWLILSCCVETTRDHKRIGLKGHLPFIASLPDLTHLIHSFFTSWLRYNLFKYLMTRQVVNWYTTSLFALIFTDHCNPTADSAVTCYWLALCCLERTSRRHLLSLSSFVEDSMNIILDTTTTTTTTTACQEIYPWCWCNSWSPCYSRTNPLFEGVVHQEIIIIVSLIPLSSSSHTPVSLISFTKEKSKTLSSWLSLTLLNDREDLFFAFMLDVNQVSCWWHTWVNQQTSDSPSDSPTASGKEHNEITISILWFKLPSLTDKR